MKTFLISGVSAIALMAMAPIAMAQDEGRGAAGGAGTNMPSAQSDRGGAPDGGNAAGAGSYLAEKGDSGPGAGDAGPGAGDKMPSSEKSAGKDGSGRDKADSPRAEGPATGREGGGDPKNVEKSAEGKSDKGDKKGADSKSAEDRAGGDSKQDGAATGKSSGESGSGAPDAAANAAGDNAKGGGSVALSGEQRSKVQSAFRGHKGHSVNVNVDVRVGTRLPHNVTLVAVPQDIVIIVPEWRRYRYVVVGDVVCIVDPDTYEIVEVIVLA